MGGWESPSHWLVLAVLAIALFGYKKLPDASRSLGRSLRIFKTELKGMAEDDKSREEAAQADRPPAQSEPTAAQPAPAAQPQPAPPAAPGSPAPPTAAE